MIYYDGEEFIIVWSKSEYQINFETEQLALAKYKLRITSDEWLAKNNYVFIGGL